MYTDITTTTKVAPDVPKIYPLTYTVTAEFDNHDGYEKTKVYNRLSLVGALEYINMFKDYRAQLDADWNSICNTESHQVTSLIDKYFNSGLEANLDAEGMMYDIWPSDENYMYMLQSYSVTYFDENGIEYNCTLK